MQYRVGFCIVPAAAVAVGDVGEPDVFFWSSSEDSKLVELWRKGKPNESLLEDAEEAPAPADETDEFPVVSFPSFPLFPYLF